MKKRIYSSFLLAVLSLMATNIAFAADPVRFNAEGFTFYTEEYGNDVTLSDIDDKDAEEIVIPAQVTNPDDGKTYNVVRIGRDFNYKSGVSTLKHFCSMPNLRKVDMSKAVYLKKIGFYESGRLNGRATNWASYVFCDNPNLTEIIFPENGALEEIILSFNNIGITSVDIPEGVKKLQGKCFGSCPELKQVRIPSTFNYVETTTINKYQYPFEDNKVEAFVILSQLTNLIYMNLYENENVI